MPVDKQILIEYADMKEEIKDLRDNAVKAFKRPAYQEYSVKQCLRKWGVDLSGKIKEKGD